MEDIANLPDLLPIYYARLFPFHDYYEWLSYGSANHFNRREFSFTLQDDIYLRYQSYRTQKELEAEIKRLVPFKIDIGAVYNVQPKDHRKGPRFVPVERELVFDIDMTDYDEVRTCCEGADICNKCWKFMTLACKILDTALRDDFGYKHILWVFSGRRGIHCWVCDQEARFLEDIERSGVAEYLQIIGGGEYMKKKVNLSTEHIHKSIRRALDIIESEFIPMCVEEQDMLGTNERMEKFLEVIPEDEDRVELKNLFGQCPSSKTRWNAFCDFVNNKKTKRGTKWYLYRHLREEVMLQYAYPRLDINVTKARNHLLKSPFCIHPKTGKVCIPFTVKTVEKFQPDKVPTIMTLIEEINEFDAKEKTEEVNNLDTTKIKDYKKTSLRKSLHIFHEFLWSLKEARKGLKAEQNDEKMEF
ncbi:hypothetical protein KPH14_008856 [Odynerus spinipes]|uniref:DNA primase n=1 Tax=Odynerus spinipes TaxID=1348599 RepID=A0AAD9R8S7_9HYME|nr:hypothetical protein KPH14_008856 [Odynerus spinipes]